MYANGSQRGRNSVSEKNICSRIDEFKVFEMPGLLILKYFCIRL